MTPEERTAMKAKMPKTRLSDEHVRNCRLVPDRLMMLDAMPKGGVVAEIGVAFGDFTKEITERCRPDELYLVDTWDTPRYQEGLQKIRSAHAEAIDAGRVKIHHGMSVKVMPELPGETFDWVYIDTNHSYETTMEELKEASRIVKPGGLICGHDFCNGNILLPWPYGVVEATLKFCVDFGWEFRFLTVEHHGHQSFALSRLPAAN